MVADLLKRLSTLAIFLTPWLAGFALFTAFPFVASFALSFCRYDMISSPEFVGAQHYTRLANELASGRAFGLAVFNTLYYAAILTPLSIGLAIVLAVMLNWKVRGQAIFRTLFFLPSVAPVVSVCILWLWLLDPRDGMVNYLLRYAWVGPFNWFTSPETFLTSGRFGSKDGLILMGLWGVGNWIVIYLAALGDIPHSLYEAAELDGAGPLRRFWHITLPGLSPVIFFNLIMGLIQSVQAFTQMYVVSEGVGAPAGSTLVLSLHLFLSAFQDLEMGYASAMAWVLFVLLMTATAGLFYSSRRLVHYRGAVR